MRSRRRVGTVDRRQDREGQVEADTTVRPVDQLQEIQVVERDRRQAQAASTLSRCDERKAAPGLDARAPRGSVGADDTGAPLGGWGASVAHGRPSGKGWRMPQTLSVDLRNRRSQVRILSGA